MYKRDSLNSDLVETIPAYPAKDGCLSRIPYSSVMAFVMCVVGVIMFAIMMIWSFNASVEQARRALDITNIPWLERVHLMFIIVAIMMGIIAVFLLIVGVLSTGSTREEIYRRPDSRRGGRVCCALAMILAYLLNILWMFVVAITAILSFVYYIFADLCRHLNGYSEGNCLDFNVFRPLVEDISHADLKLCGGNAQEFCALTNTVFSWNVVGFVGAMIICLGLVQFLASNASNYAHVNNEQRYIELKEVLYLEGAQDYPPLQSQFPVRSYPSPPPVPPPIPQAQPRPRKQRPMDEVKKTRSHSHRAVMGKKPRPKSKEQKLTERRKNFLDEEEPEELFLDEGASAEESSSDEAPEEVSTKKPRLDDNADIPVEEPPQKKKRKRRIRKEESGIYSVETDNLKLKVVAEKNVTPAQILHPPIHFKDVLLQEVTRAGRRKAGTNTSKIPDKWLKASSKK